MDESKEKISRTIYEALSLPGDEPPDFSMSDEDINREDTEDSAINCGQRSVFQGLVELTECFCNLADSLIELKKTVNSINFQDVKKVYESVQKGATNCKPEEPYVCQSLEQKQSPFSYTPHFDNSDDDGYGLSSDKDLDELMFYDLMDDD